MGKRGNWVGEGKTVNNKRGKGKFVWDVKMGDVTKGGNNSEKKQG
jgi:hypothetical protein